VTINPLVTCGTCQACLAGRDNLCPTRQIISMPPREGAFAEYWRCRSAIWSEVPDRLRTDKAALAEPIACRLARVRLAKRQAAPRTHARGGPGDRRRRHRPRRGDQPAAQGVADVTLVEPNAQRRSYLGLDAGFHVFARPRRRGGPGISIS
jgi:hypothetical protein